MTREDAIDVLKHNYPSACFAELCEAVKIAIQALSAEQEKRTETHMCDLISRQAVIESINALHEKPNAWLDCAVEAVKNLPSAQKTGKWIDITKSGVCFMWKCSECGYDDIEDTNYCPNCGALLKGEK